MDVLGYLLRGIAIGLLFGIPIGAVGTMTVQNTVNAGMSAGLLTGLGSSVADCVYAVIGAFGFTVISDWLLDYQKVILLLGGGFICYMAYRAWNLSDSVVKRKQQRGNLKLFAASFVIGITNPTAILTFLFAFTYFGIADIHTGIGAAALVAGVFVGTFLWWITLTFITNMLTKKAKLEQIHRLNRIFAGILLLFAVCIFMKAAGI